MKRSFLGVMVFLILTLLSQSTVAFAQNDNCTFGKPEVPLPGQNNEECIEDISLGKYTNTLAQFSIALIVAIGLITIVVAGYMYMTAGGNAKQVGAAKTLIISALMGIALALLSYVIIKTLNPNLLKLEDPRFDPVNLGT